MLSCRRREQIQDLSPVHSRRPGAWRGPWLRVYLDGICTTRQEQLHQGGASPAARPAERRAREQRVANVETGASVEQDGGELNPHAMIARDDLVQHGLAVVRRAVMRSAARQDQREALAAFSLLLRA